MNQEPLFDFWDICNKIDNIFSEKCLECDEIIVAMFVRKILEGQDGRDVAYNNFLKRKEEISQAESEEV